MCKSELPNSVWCLPQGRATLGNVRSEQSQTHARQCALSARFALTQSFDRCCLIVDNVCTIAIAQSHSSNHTSCFLRMLRSPRNVRVYCIKFSAFINEPGVRKNFKAELHCSATCVLAKA